MIDTHTHIFDAKFDSDRNETVKRAIESGVTRMVLPGIDRESNDRLIGCVRLYPDVCFGTVGLHPTSVNDNPKWRDEVDEVERLLRSRPVEWVGVGEIGLDLYWSRDFFKEQVEAFVRQVELSVEYALPIVIHTRDAWDEVIEVMDPYWKTTRGVFHSFSGSLAHFEKIEAASPNYFFGIGGVVTYKKSTLPDVVARIPLERIVLETDSPYLPPVPHRGERNESSYLGLVAQKIAYIKELEIEEVIKITDQNAVKLFF